MTNQRIPIKAALQNIKPDLWWAAAVAAYVGLLFWYRYREVWGTPYWGNDDVVQHLIWSFRDQHFKPGDPWVITSGALQPWGYYGLIWLLSRFIDPVTISRIFPVFTLYAACLSAFFLVKRRFGWALGLCAVLMFSNIPLERMAGFMARAFSIPFMLLFLCFWDAGRKQAAGWTAAVSAFFYPSAFLTLGCFTVLNYAWDLLAERREQTGNRTLKSRLIVWPQKDLLWLAGCFIVPLGFLFLKSWTLNHHPLVGPFFSREALMSMPEFAPGGRVDFHIQMDPGQPWKFPLRHYLKLPLPDITLVLLAALFAGSWFFLKQHRRYFRHVILFAASGVACFYLAQWLLPRLFQPDRYLYFSLLSAWFLFVIGALSPSGGGRGRNPSGGGRGRNPALAFRLIPILVIPLTAWSVFKARSPKESGIYRYGDYAALYDKIKSFDHPVKIAGPTEVTPEIPWFCRQSVLFSDESCHALYFTRYYDLIQEPARDFIRAYTATDPIPVLELFRDHQVDYLILDKFFFEHNRMYLFEPFQTEVKKRTEGKTASDYWLTHAPDSLLIPVDWRYTLLDGARMLEVYGNEPTGGN